MAGESTGKTTRSGNPTCSPRPGGDIPGTSACTSVSTGSRAGSSGHTSPRSSRSDNPGTRTRANFPAGQSFWRAPERLFSSFWLVFWHGPRSSRVTVLFLADEVLFHLCIHPGGDRNGVFLHSPGHYRHQLFRRRWRDGRQICPFVRFCQVFVPDGWPCACLPRDGGADGPGTFCR